MELLSKAESAFSGKIVESHTHHDNATIVLERADLIEILTRLRDDSEFAFNMLVDLSAVDFFGQEPRFEVVYHLYSLRLNHRLRVKVRVAEDEAWLPSVTELWKAANWLEREVWDMFGVSFQDHPKLSRILMYEEFQGHPLRKDYPVAKRQPLVEERDPIANPWDKK